MKVLFVCSGNSKNFEIIPFIKEQGNSLVRQGIKVEYFPVIGKGLAGYYKAGKKLKKHLRRNRYDLIHAHFTLSGWSAVIGAAGKTPVVLSLMGSDAYGEYVGVNQVQFSSRINTLLTYLIQPFVKGIISKSQNIEDYVYLKHKSHIIPNGINRDKFRPDPAAGFSKDQKQVLFLGNAANPRKNFELVQKAVDLLNLPDITIVNPYPVAHHEIPNYLNAVNVLVVPSFMEGSPNVVKEAMACNCPIVSTDMGDVKWVLGDTPGCYVSSFEPEDFAQKLAKALQFSERHGRTNGEERIEELGLDAERVAARVISVYRKVLGQPQEVAAPNATAAIPVAS
ncbi:glycosyltransferase family 4 protein [Pontibacter qinzhouensis]|uniref:Glycosyltransferase family 4 protein n=1 Tax=Pontibacter qinzhouensis TaxID=2603253 RepID=A0A5C8KAC7_9BACT|nr:glycosyltransferase [Pontibacter qinzhouensis]TXK46763.1 glycosyltransferase family 4 protein [Pontibacter qinzhouensis]